MVRDVARVARITDRRLEGAHLKIGLCVEARDFPAACRIDGRAPQGEKVLAVRIGLSFIAVTQIGSPFRQRGVRRNPGVVGQFLLACDECQSTLFAFPVVRPDVVVTHRSGFPLVVCSHRHRDVAAVFLDCLKRREELGLGRGDFDAQLGKSVLVVDEAVDHAGHRHTKTGRAIIGLPGGLCHIREVRHRFKIAQVSQVAGVVKRQRGVKWAAGDQVARGTSVQFGVQHGVVLCRC